MMANVWDGGACTPMAKAAPATTPVVTAAALEDPAAAATVAAVAAAATDAIPLDCIAQTGVGR